MHAALGSGGSVSSLLLWIPSDLVVLRRTVLASDHTLPRADSVYLEEQWRYTGPTVLAHLGQSDGQSLPSLLNRFEGSFKELRTQIDQGLL